MAILFYIIHSDSNHKPIPIYTTEYIVVYAALQYNGRRDVRTMITKHKDKIGTRYICDCQPDINNQSLEFGIYERTVICNRCGAKCDV